ncbi:V-type ATP synthase subunit D [Labeo rohita]|uniref:V-type ATP synthase subunit D n=1 Tax=Labeo rohita TaxID=84645 RepID=A0ABQ8LB26_LABRO|nr:V-type ATP synthase subunit D [Labeo rohita]
MSAVRDMYEGLDVEDMSETAQKRHRETQLNQHPDVLFRIYTQDRLHVLLFRPTDDGWWINTLRDEYRGISAQWTFKHAANQPIRHVMNLSGNRGELERFCNEFPHNLGTFNAHEEQLVLRIIQMEKTKAVVRDVYDFTDWKEEQRKSIIDKQLDGNPDVLFRVYKPVHPPDEDNLHVLLFRPTKHPEQWVTLIEKANLTAQLTNRRKSLPVREVINVSGNLKKLQAFCTAFPGHLQEINGSFTESHDSVQEIEHLRALIQDQDARILNQETRLKYLEKMILPKREDQEASEQHVEAKFENLNITNTDEVKEVLPEK